MYCWKTPSKHDITLEVDHKISVKNGWWNEDYNLITSCKECNRWKRWDSVILQSEVSELKDQAIDLKERLEQIKKINSLKQKINIERAKENSINYIFVDEILLWYEDSFLMEIKNVCKESKNRFWCDYDLIEECLSITMARFRMEEFSKKNFIAYFYGVMKKKNNISN